ncbi:MAG TPA: PEP-CTERM sorting domain-containing protein [Vicinamibacterales bacterium]|nr:PEP-CTERM sorting domain-containing protein [Vicinamibacterales bacterium]
MIRRFLLFALCLAFPYSAAAGPIVTWEAFGTITRAISYYPPPPDPPPPFPYPPQAPPLGTEWTFEVHFDPTAVVKTAGTSASSPCYTTSATGTFTLGGTSYSMTSGSNAIYTNSRLPGSGCVVGEPGMGANDPGAIEFWMFPRPVADDPWRLSETPFFLLARYDDLLHEDGTLPLVPTYSRPGSLMLQNWGYQIEGPFSPVATNVEQPSPVPEPGTLTMLGIGLAVAARRRWRERQSSR